jgi:hypothetical protein
MKRIIFVLLAVTLFGCGQKQPQVTEVGARNVDPQNVSKDRTLSQPVPVIAVKFEATDTGYTMRAFRANGTPTSKIDQNRDVVIKALDGQGTVLGSVSIFNPREVRTTGSKNPGTASRPNATFTVFFDQPDNIRNIEVNVVRGPNEGLRQTYPVNPRELPPLTADSDKGQGTASPSPTRSPAK